MSEVRDLRKLIGCRIKQARLEANMTQDQLASKLNYVREYISIIESGKQSFEVNKLVLFSNIFNKPITYFLTE